MQLNYNTVVKKAFEINNNKFFVSVRTYPVESGHWIILSF